MCNPKSFQDEIKDQAVCAWDDSLAEQFIFWKKKILTTPSSSCSSESPQICIWLQYPWARASCWLNKNNCKSKNKMSWRRCSNTKMQGKEIIYDVPQNGETSGRKDSRRRKEAREVLFPFPEYWGEGSLQGTNQYPLMTALKNSQPPSPQGLSGFSLFKLRNPTEQELFRAKH